MSYKAKKGGEKRCNSYIVSEEEEKGKGKHRRIGKERSLKLDP